MVAFVFLHGYIFQSEASVMSVSWAYIPIYHARLSTNVTGLVSGGGLLGGDILESEVSV